MIRNHLPGGFLLLILFFVESIKAQQNNFNEDYSPYVIEIKNWKGKILREGPPMPDSNAKTILKPSTKMIERPGGLIPLRIFKPANIRAVVLDIHGGGWSAGMAAFNDRYNDELARTCSVAVVSVDYRLAPDYPFPACIEDCYAAAKWIVDNVMKEFKTDKMFIAGGSAGGHLAAVTTLYVRDSLHAINMVKGVNLEYGLYDFSGTPSFRMATDSTPFLSRQIIDMTVEMLMPGWTMDQKKDPKYSPLYANLHGLPPAIFTVGTADPLLDDTYFMEARWRGAGNKTYLAVYPECPHAFDSLPVKMADIAKAKIFKWIIKQLD
ncbi:MAG: alpha/beta hydrolase [Chitinophagaceae bacterium]